MWERACHALWRRESRSRLSDVVEGKTWLSPAYFDAILPVCSIVVEVGGHVGIDTEQFALLRPEGHVFSFEPSPSLFQIQRRRLNRYKNVVCVPAAVSDRAGVALFNGSSGSTDAAGSLLRPTRHHDLFPDVFFICDNRSIVPTVTLDEYGNLAAWSSIDLLWVDAQGAELHVLRGATRKLASTEWIYLEASHEPLYEGGATLSQIERFLAPFGFKLELNLVPENGAGNALFRNGHMDS
jgi:FkbM family methyltransferase